VNNTGDTKITKSPGSPAKGQENNQNNVPDLSKISSIDIEVKQDFRTRSPIVEDPNEDARSGRSTPSDNILDEPVPQSSPAIPSESIILTPKRLIIDVSGPENSQTKSPVASPRVSITSESEIKAVAAKNVTIPTIKTSEPDKKEKEDEDEEDNDDEEVPKTGRESQASTLKIPSQKSPTPTPSSMPSSPFNDKGKSKVSGKTLSGWI
jgi:hypothetical protein